MEFFNNLFTIAAILLLACISPGPDFVAVTSHALSNRRSGLRVASGIAAAIAIWSAVSILGLALVFSRIAGLYEIVRLLGAAYLLYLGIGLLLGAARPADRVVRVRARPADGTFIRGFLIGITNPKSAAFFSSLFATVLPAAAPVWVYAAVVAIAGSVSLVWFWTLALLFSGQRAQRVYARARRAIDATMGALLTLIGARLALAR